MVRKAQTAWLSMLFMIFAQFTWCAGGQESSNVGPAKIQIELKNSKNILQNAQDSRVSTRIGRVGNSKLHGFNAKINLGTVNNIVQGASDSSSVINIGSVENTDAGNVQIKVDAKKVENKVLGGKNNHAITNIGVLKDTHIQGGALLEVKAGNIENVVKGGSDNEAEVSIGYDPAMPAARNSTGNSDRPRPLPLIKRPQSQNQYGPRAVQEQERQLLLLMRAKAMQKIKLLDAFEYTKEGMGFAYTAPVNSKLFQAIVAAFDISGPELIKTPGLLKRLHEEGKKELAEIDKKLAKYKPLTKSEIAKLKTADKKAWQRIEAINRYNANVSAINRMLLKSAAISDKAYARTNNLDNYYMGKDGQVTRWKEHEVEKKLAHYQNKVAPYIGELDRKSMDAVGIADKQREKYQSAKKLIKSAGVGNNLSTSKIHRLNTKLEGIRRSMEKQNDKVAKIEKFIEKGRNFGPRM